MGRRKAKDKLNLTKEAIIGTVNESRTIADAAKVLGVSDRTLKKYLAEYGYQKPRPIPKHYAAVVKWVREHSDTLLPRSVSGICRMTGCSKDAVATYMYRRRNRERKKLRRLPDLRTLWVVLEQPSHTRISTRWLRSYTLKLDPWSFKVVLVGVLKNSKPVTVLFGDVGELSGAVRRSANKSTKQVLS